MVTFTRSCPYGVNNKIINQQFKSDHPLKENGYVMIVFNDFRRSSDTMGK